MGSPTDLPTVWRKEISWCQQSPGGLAYLTSGISQKNLMRNRKGIRGFRAIALLSVFSKYYIAVLVDLLHEEEEPIEWKKLHVGAERSVNCEHMHVTMTNLLQKHWEWQENRNKSWEPGKFSYRTMYRASLDVKTAFDVAKPSVVSKIFLYIREPMVFWWLLYWRKCRT